MTHLSHTAQYDTYLAHPDNNPEYRVLLKVFDAQYLLPTATYADFQRLERRLQRLHHPHIVAMLALGQEQGKPYLVSEYQPGISLRQHLEQIPSGHLSFDDAVTIVMQIGQAVAFAHTQGVVHQDIRPENILLHDQGHALLINFSLSDIIREPGFNNRTDRRAVSYLSPEQTIGIAGPASDQYALGCLLYELLTGNLPNPVSLQQHLPLPSSLPDALETLILPALALKPEERYPSVATFLDELQRVAQPKLSALSSTIEDENISTLHQALTAHAHITSFDMFSTYDPPGNALAAQSLPHFLPEPANFAGDFPEHLLPESANFIEDLPAQFLPEPANFTEDFLEHLLPEPANFTEDFLEHLLPEPANFAKGLPDSLLPEPASFAGDQLVTSTTQNVPTRAQAEQNDKTIRTPRSWKRPTGAIGAIVILLTIALLLVYSFHSGTQPEVKHAPTSTPMTTIGSQPTVNSTSIPAIPRPTTTRPVATPKPTGQTPPHNPVAGATPQPPAPTATPRVLGVGSIQIDSGGSGDGSFVGDTDFSDTTPSRPSSSSHDSSNAIDTSGVSNPAPQSVYQSARIGDCLYTISHLTPGADYAVRLHFAETYWTQAGKRAFDVTLNGRLVLHNFDIFALAGGANKALVEQFVATANQAGVIAIRFQTVHDNAQINGIEVLAV